MTAYIRTGLVLAVLCLTAWGGWKARAWLEDSRALDQANAERDAAIERERAAEIKAQDVEKARAKIAGELATERAKIHATVAPIIKRIPVYVDRGSCRVSVDGVRAINSARGAIVPDAERRTNDHAITRRADSGL